MEGEDDNLTCRAKTEGNETSKAGSDEERLAAFCIPVIILLAHDRHRAPSEDGELHLVGMAAEGELGSPVGDDLTPPG